MSQAKRSGRIAAGAMALAAVAACGSGSTTSSSGGSSSSGQQHIGGSVNVWAEWTGQEQQAFLASLQPFETATGITVNYAGKGNNTDTAVVSAIQGGAPPDVALVPDPGTLQTLAKAGLDQGPDQHCSAASARTTARRGTSSPRSTASSTACGSRAPTRTPSGTTPPSSRRPGSPRRRRPGTASHRCRAAAGGRGHAVLAVHRRGLAARGSLAERLPQGRRGRRLQQARRPYPEVDRPHGHHLLQHAGAAVQQDRVPARRPRGARSPTSFPQCVDKVFPKTGNPQAAMVMEADFVVSEITGNSPTIPPVAPPETGGAPCTADPSKTPCYDFFPFPAPSADSANELARIQGAGDVAIQRQRHPAGDRPSSSTWPGPDGRVDLWAHLGGFATANKSVPASAYPDRSPRRTPQALVRASSFVFSLDDLQGELGEADCGPTCINFLKDPSVGQHHLARGDHGPAGHGRARPAHQRPATQQRGRARTSSPAPGGRGPRYAAASAMARASASSASFATRRPSTPRNAVPTAAAVTAKTAPTRNATWYPPVSAAR